MLGFFYGVGESSLMSFKHWFTSSSVPVWLKSFFLVTSHSHHDISLPLLFLYVLVHFFLIILSTISCMPSGSFFSNCWILSFMIHSWFSCESTQSSICAFAASPQLSDWLTKLFYIEHANGCMGGWYIWFGEHVCIYGFWKHRSSWCDTECPLVIKLCCNDCHDKLQAFIHFGGLNLAVVIWFAF